MKIIVAGAGNVGRKLLEELSIEEHNLVVVDKDATLVENVVDSFDVMGVVGNCISAEILKNAGVEDADLLIACTPHDEMNILCCMVAKKLGVGDTIARVRKPEYFTLFRDVELGLSMLVNPEYETAMEISRLLRFPSAIKIEPFAAGKVEVVEIVVTPKSPLDKLQLKKIAHRFQEKLLVCAVQRGKDVFIPNGDFVLEAWDEIYITASPKDIGLFFREMGMPRGVNKIMIAGGSRTAFYLANELKKTNVSVKIVETDEEKCNFLDENLEKVEVICGDATDQVLLEEEGLGSMDAYIALCGIDERNIVTSLFAGRKGVKKVIAKVDNPALAGLWEEKSNQSIVSICTTTVNEIIRYVRGKESSGGGKFSKLYRIIDDRVEILEFIVSEHFEGVDRPLKDLKLKGDTLIAAIVRNGALIVPGGNDAIYPGDIVLIVTLQEFSGNLNEILER